MAHDEDITILARPIRIRPYDLACPESAQSLKNDI